MIELTERQRDILEFCRKGKSSIEVSAHIGLAYTSIHEHLHKLQVLGCLDKVAMKGRGQGASPALYVTRSEELSPAVKDTVRSAEVFPRWNDEFMKWAHNPFRMGAPA